MGCKPFLRLRFLKHYVHGMQAGDWPQTGKIYRREASSPVFLRSEIIWE
jgi:hypothetical protein